MDPLISSYDRTVLINRPFAQLDEKQQRPLGEERFVHVAVQAAMYLDFHTRTGSPPIDHATERRFLLALLRLSIGGAWEKVNMRVIANESFRKRIQQRYSTADGEFDNLFATEGQGNFLCYYHNRSVLYSSGECTCNDIVDSESDSDSYRSDGHTHGCHSHEQYCYSPEDVGDYVVLDHICLNGTDTCVVFHVRTAQRAIRAHRTVRREVVMSRDMMFPFQTLYAWTQQTFVGYRQLAMIIQIINEIQEDDPRYADLSQSVIFRFSRYHMYHIQVWGVILSFLDPDTFPHFFFNRSNRMH